MSDSRVRPDVEGINKRNHKRFRDIGKRKVRKDLEKYMTDDSFVGHQGKKKVRVPIPRINLPRIRFGPNNSSGDGKGYGFGNGVSGQPGDILRPGSPGGRGGTGAGDQPGEHGLTDFELTRDELAKLLGEKFELPNMVRKHSGEMEVVGHKYSGKTHVGPDVMIIPKDTIIQALIRSIAEGVYDEEDPVILPLPDDFRYRTIKPILRPTSKAVVFFLRDVSASMSWGNRAALAHAASYWLELWIEHCYAGKQESVYVLHDHQAWEATRDEFLRTTAGGGTLMTSALQLTQKIIKERYDPKEWNIYIFHYGDGDCFSSDLPSYLSTLIDLIPSLALYGYTQVCESNGRDFHHLLSQWREQPNAAVEIADYIRVALMTDFDQLPEAIRTLLS